jgi:hypothetical protein
MLTELAVIGEAMVNYLWPEAGRTPAAPEAPPEDLAAIALNARVKPVLVKVFNVADARYEWRCSDTTAFCNAWADDPVAAYEDWLRRFAEWRRHQLE